MFERIARRRADRPDDADATASVGEGSVTPDAASQDPPTTVTPAAEGSAADAPTERIAPVEAGPQDAPTENVPAVPAPVDQPTTAQPAAGPPPIRQLSPAAPAGDAQSPQPGATLPTDGTAQPAAGDAATPASAEATAVEPPRRAGFRARGRMRRRLRYLRKLRELQVRDLGGLAFDLRRFERKRDDLVAQKVDHIRACDDELRALELALAERRELRDVREPGIGGTCPRCFAVFGSADRFCSNCGAALGGAVQGPAQVPVAAPLPPAAAGPAASDAQPPAPADPPPAGTDRPPAGGPAS